MYNQKYLETELPLRKEKLEDEGQEKPPQL
jgi:hypothetical protein